MIPIFDAHLDLAWNALSFDRNLTLGVGAIREAEQHMTDERSRGKSTVSLPELQKAGVRVCLATVLARSGRSPTRRDSIPRSDLDYASEEIAFASAQGQLAYYRLLEAQGWIRILRTSGELSDHWRNAPGDARVGVILSMEGADPAAEPYGVDGWWGDGLRALGFAHYGVSQYAHGTGTDGPLTERGRRLLGDCERLGLALDVTHLSDRSMEEALDGFGGAVLASHHNCRALVPGDRQLTDHQIRKLTERGGVIGAVFDAWMLVPGWKRGESSRELVSFETVVDHIDHICQIAGDARHSGIGSDLDGGFGFEQVPREIDTIADLQALAEILAARGYSDRDIEGIFFANWLRFFEEVLPD
jgi:membrane dipeptidase